MKHSGIDKTDCEDQLRFETLLADLSARFVNLPAEQVDAEIQRAQRQVCECLGLDLAVLWQWEVDLPGVFTLTHHYRRGDGPPISRELRAAELWPWSLREVRAGRSYAIASVDDVPEGLERDRESWRHFGIKSVATFPLMAGGGAPFGAASFHAIESPRTWSERLIKRMDLVAQIFANAIERKRNEQALGESEARLSLAAESADAGLWSLNLASKQFWVTAKTRALFAFLQDEVVTWDRFMALVHPDDRQHVQHELEEVTLTGRECRVEYRVSCPDGTVRWMASRGRLHRMSPDAHQLMMGVTQDITERKLAEERLKSTLKEVERLRDRLQNENIYLREQVHRESGVGAIIGESEPVRKMLAMARKVAPTDSAVLITGETGTGKELLAQAIHDMSSRKSRIMVKVNCAALPAPLIESELFGREKGAYTGAMTQQAGRFEIANASTIFLDEIGDLPLDLQAKLLRVLQDGHYERLGSNRVHKTDVRVIAATNRDLAAMVRDGKFREDLFHRLNVFPIEVPSLRARGADIPLLIWKFVQEFNVKMGRSVDSIPRPVIERLKQYPWPGNVRELRNVIERAMIINEGPSLAIPLPEGEKGTAALPSTLEDVERAHILDVLERTHWRIRGKGGAAELLGLVPTTLHSRLKKLGLSRPKG